MNKSSPHGGAIHEGTLISGTLRTQDLLRAYADEFERLLPFNSAKLVQEAREFAQAIDNGEEYDDMYAAEVVGELHDNLDTIAMREGFYFGNVEGDGADFGFWRIDEETD